MTLYSKQGSEPTDLPFIDTDEEGFAWTNLAENADGRDACGWAEAPDVPAHDPDTQMPAWDDGAWILLDREPEAIAADLEAFRQARIADLAAERYARQQLLDWSGQPMPADDTTIGRISAKVAIMDKRGALPDDSFTWKPAPATFVQLSYAQLVAYGDAIDLHIQACFDHEEDLCGQLIAAADKAAIAAIDIMAGWPA